MCGSLRGSPGGVKQVSRQNRDEDENDVRCLPPASTGLWTSSHAFPLKYPVLQGFSPRERKLPRKKSKKLHKHSCVFSAIRIDHGHRRGGHWFAQTSGRLAQLVERFVYTEDVGSSSLSSPTIPFPFVLCLFIWANSATRYARALSPRGRAVLQGCRAFFSPWGEGARRADKGQLARLAENYAQIATPIISGHPVPPLAEAPRGATAVIFRTGSGDRLTSRCCHETTWPSRLFHQQS